MGISMMGELGLFFVPCLRKFFPRLARCLLGQLFLLAQNGLVLSHEDHGFESIAPSFRWSLWGHTKVRRGQHSSGVDDLHGLHCLSLDLDAAGRL